MKRILLSLVAIATISLSSFGQAPEGFKYQAVVRDAGNLILNNQAVGMRLTVQQGSIGGTAVYQETFAPSTNAYGLVNLEIGTGTSTDDFSTIDWSAGPYFIETAIDINGGTSYVIMGTSQLMSVPYALYAKTSGNGAGPQGPAGANGTNGTDGAIGLTGPAGPQGATGLTGAQGPAGPQGTNGTNGATGPQGPIGNDGAVGATGPQGLIGPAGNDGVTGPQGPIGLTGSAGATGAAGTNGTNGTDGAIGLTGPAGPQGATGLQGLTGPQGATGLLSNGTIAGNTPYWDGSQWVVNNSNIHNNGAGVGIGTAAPNASAKVEIASTTQGFLPPRMTTAQRDAILSPAAGLVIFNTSTNCLNFFIGSGWNETCGTLVVGTFPVGTINCAGATAVINVTNPTTGKIWMDRNLGASQVATSSSDAASYRDLYQWGRRADGHQCRTSATTAALSSIDQPAHGNFILAPSTPYDWRSPQNTNLWQGVNGINNPCPSGYRIPTEPELEAERLSWSVNTSVGAFASVLKLPMAGGRDGGNGSLYGVGTGGRYWSSTVSSTTSRNLIFGSSDAFMLGSRRAFGIAVRCLKD